MNDPLPEPGPQLAWHNRQVLAERLHWPDRTLAVCEAVDDTYPGWYASWTRGGGLTWNEPGFYAIHRHWRRMLPKYAYGSTPEQFHDAIEAHPLTTQRRADPHAVWRTGEDPMRRALADAQKWPDHVVDGCEWVDLAAGPQWFTVWHTGRDPRFPTGYYAVLPDTTRPKPTWLHGTTPQELLRQIELQKNPGTTQG